MINYYVVAGGHNPPLSSPVGDGNELIALTGERYALVPLRSPGTGPALACGKTDAVVITVS